MKFIIIFVLFLCCLTNSVFSQKPVIIIGQLKNMEDGTHIVLMKEEGSVGTQVAKDSVVNGHFRIEYAPKDGDLGRYLVMSFDKGFPSMSLKLWGKAGHTINIEGENKFVYTWKVKSDIPEQKDWASFVQPNKLLWDEYQKLSAIRHDMIEKVYSDNSTPTERKAARTMVDSLDSISNTYEYKIQKQNLSLLQKRKMTIVRLEVLNDAANLIKWNHIEEFRSPVTKMYNSLAPNFRNTAYGEQIALILYPIKVVKVGEPMYDTILTDLNGKTHRLADFRGKYILLDFWSFGCGPCHASVPEMKEISEKLKDSLAVISLTSDNKKMWKEASEYFKMTWNNFSDGKENRGIYAKYGVRGIPNYVLIAPDGIIKDSWTGYGEGSLKSKIKELTNFSMN